MKLTGHTYVLQQFDKLEYEEAFAKPELLKFGKKTSFLTLDGLEKEQLIQIDHVTRIKLALRNQGHLAMFVCYLDFEIGNFAFDVTENI
mgnify:CR=1 FL=1